MAEFSSWFQNNWPNLIGAAGIIGSLWASTITIREDCKWRQISNLIALDERQRAVLGEIRQRPELKRILSENADLLSQPLTPEEEVSMWQIVQQLETGWRVEKVLNRGELKFLARDVGSFLSLPLPRAVWERLKEFRNPNFVRFVTRAIERHGRRGEL
jgi:hypothetical protein